MNDNRLDAWLQTKPTATAAAYRTTCQQFLAHTRVDDLAAVTPGSILDWKQTLRRQGRSDQTIINALSRVARFFDYAVATGIHPGPNPARNEDISRPSRAHGGTTLPLTLDQITHILRTAGSDTRSGARACALILVTLAGANPIALRWSEATGLPPAVTATLDRYAKLTRIPRDNDAFIFVAWRTNAPWRSKNRSAPISRAQISNTLSRLGRRAGLPSLSQRILTATVRSLRRTPRGNALFDRFLQFQSPVDDS